MLFSVCSDSMYNFYNYRIINFYSISISVNRYIFISDKIYFYFLSFINRYLNIISSYIDKCDINKIQIANKNFAESIIFSKKRSRRQMCKNDIFEAKKWNSNCKSKFLRARQTRDSPSPWCLRRSARQARDLPSPQRSRDPKASLYQVLAFVVPSRPLDDPWTRRRWSRDWDCDRARSDTGRYPWCRPAFSSALPWTPVWSCSWVRRRRRADSCPWTWPHRYDDLDESRSRRDARTPRGRFAESRTRRTRSRASTRRNPASIEAPEAGPPVPAPASARPRSSRAAIGLGTLRHLCRAVVHPSPLLEPSIVVAHSPTYVRKIY